MQEAFDHCIVAGGRLEPVVISGASLANTLNAWANGVVETAVALRALPEPSRWIAGKKCLSLVLVSAVADADEGDGDGNSL